MRLHLHEWGDPAAPTLVCLHGITSHGSRFRPLAEAGLAERRHVVAPDLRGHGRSGWEPPWSLEQHLEDVLESVPDDARLWVGHSFGGRLVLELAVRMPERVERAVLLDPALWVPPPEALRRAERVRPDESWASLEEAVDWRYEQGLVKRAPRGLVERDLREHAVLGGDGRIRMRYCASAVIAAHGEVARTLPQEPLRVPVHVVRSLESEVCPPLLIDAYRELAGGLLTAGEVPGGHTPMWDAVTETVTAIEAHLG